MLFCVLVNLGLAALNVLIFGPQNVVETVSVFAPNGEHLDTYNAHKIVYNGGWFASAFQLFVFVPSVSLAWRRMHDTGRKGWLLLIPVLLFAFATIAPILVALGIAETISLLSSFNTVLVLVHKSLSYLLMLLNMGCLFLVAIWLSLPSQQFSNKWGPQIPGT